MRALILAAGLGTRLRPITNDIPKSIVKVNKTPILFKQIENLKKNNIEDIIVIAGYKSDIMIERINNKYSDIEIIENKDFDKTNNMYSAYLAKDKLYNKDFILMNADVFFESSIIKKIIDDSNPNVIATQVGLYNLENMKVKVDNEEIKNISKNINQDESFGVSIDIYKFSNEGSKAIFDKMENYIDKQKDLNQWTEVALNDILNNVVFKPCDIEDDKWIEIDNHEDLKEAERVFNE